MQVEIAGSPSKVVVPEGITFPDFEQLLKKSCGFMAKDHIAVVCTNGPTGDIKIGSESALEGALKTFSTLIKSGKTPILSVKCTKDCDSDSGRAYRSSGSNSSRGSAGGADPSKMSKNK